MVWVEHRRRRDQVRICCHPFCLDVDISPHPWCRASLMHRSASRARLTARSPRRMFTSAHHNFLVSSSSPQAIKTGRRAVVVLMGILLGMDGVNLINYDIIKVCNPLDFLCAFDDDSEGVVHIRRPHITSLVHGQTTGSAQTLTTYPRQFRCDRPRRLPNMSVGSRSGTSRLRRGLCHPWSSCSPTLPVSGTVARARLLHILLLRHPPHQNNRQ